MQAAEATWPGWLKRDVIKSQKACRDCGRPIALLDAALEDGSTRVQIIDPRANGHGWVRVSFDPKRVWVRRFDPGRWDVSFKRHYCE